MLVGEAATPGQPRWYSLIILAAGKSTRMGENKLLMPLLGEPIIRRVVRKALASRADEVVVVLGHDAERVREALLGLSCRYVMNERFEEGQSASVKAGLAAVRDQASAVLVLPGDVAFVEPGHINAVIEAHGRTGASIVIASYEGRGGHPILIDRSLYDEVMAIDEETFGLKAVIKRHRGSVLKIEAGSPAVLIDIDTREDLEKAANFLKDRLAERA